MLNIQKIKEIGGIFGKGLLLQMAPGIAGGFINDYFHEWKVDEAKIAADVRNDRCLWANLTEEQWRQIGDAAQAIGGLDFLTPGLVIDSIKKDFPTVASLFLNWPEASEWLSRQLDMLREELSTH